MAGANLLLKELGSNDSIGNHVMKWLLIFVSFVDYITWHIYVGN